MVILMGIINAGVQIKGILGEPVPLIKPIVEPAFQGLKIIIPCQDVKIRPQRPFGQHAVLFHGPGVQIKFCQGHYQHDEDQKDKKLV